MNDAGTLTFTGHDGGSAMNDVDDVMPYAGGNEGWDLVASCYVQLNLEELLVLVELTHSNTTTQL